MNNVIRLLWLGLGIAMMLQGNMAAGVAALAIGEILQAKQEILKALDNQKKQE